MQSTRVPNNDANNASGATVTKRDSIRLPTKHASINNESESSSAQCSKTLASQSSEHKKPTVDLSACLYDTRSRRIMTWSWQLLLGTLRWTLTRVPRSHFCFLALFAGFVVLWLLYSTTLRVTSQPKHIFAIFGPVSSVALQLTPFPRIRATIKESDLRKRLELRKNMPVSIYVLLWLNSFIGTLYGVRSGEGALVVTCGAGVALQLIWMAVWFHMAHPSRWILFAVGSLLLHFTLYHSFARLSNEFVGVLYAFLCILPLGETALRAYFKDEVDGLITSGMLLSSGIWTMFGYYTVDAAVLIPSLGSYAVSLIILGKMAHLSANSGASPAHADLANIGKDRIIELV